MKTYNIKFQFGSQPESYKLDVQAGPNGKLSTGNFSVTGSTISNLTVTAIPNSGYALDYWDLGDSQVSTPAITINTTLSDDTTYVANFKRTQSMTPTTNNIYVYTDWIDNATHVYSDPYDVISRGAVLTTTTSTSATVLYNFTEENVIYIIVPVDWRLDSCISDVTNVAYSLDNFLETHNSEYRMYRYKGLQVGTGYSDYINIKVSK